jgi:CRP-like cAMP-binding protein
MSRLEFSAPLASPLNRLLAVLPPEEYALLHPCLECVPLQFKAPVHEPGQPITHLYFPTSGVISLLLPLEERTLGIEVGVVGREGMVGLAVFLGASTTIFRAMVQAPGEALRIPVEDFRSRVGRHTVLHEHLLRFTHLFLSQLSLSIACNALHPMEKRMCRWLLAMHDRVDSDRFPLTHEFLAAMLGVRRASVSEAARGLRQAGLIRYGGGQLTVLDRAGLESAACPCHRKGQGELHRLLG